MEKPYDISKKFPVSLISCRIPPQKPKKRRTLPKLRKRSKSRRRHYYAEKADIVGFMLQI